MNQVVGKVLLKETNVGIPDLLVEVFDVDPGTKPEESLGDGAAGTGIVAAPKIVAGVSLSGLLGDRLGSVATGEGGRFKLEYDDPDFRRRNPQEQRPDLLLIVRAPDLMDAQGDSRILYVSKDIRQGAGLSETYLILIPTKALAAVGLAAPTDLRLETEDPDAVVQKVGLSLTRQVKTRDEVRKIAAQQVAAERSRVKQVESLVETRLLEKLTGVPAALADRLNYVPPGGDVESAMYRAIGKTIEGSINPGPPARGYLALSPAQAEAFRNADGTFRRDVAPAEVEPLLFGGVESRDRPTILVREDPLELLARSSPQADLFEETEAPAPPEAIADGAPFLFREPRAAADAPGPSAPESVPDLVGRLLDTMTSPEEAVAFGVKPRATQEAVQNEIGSLRLRSGPADVPAFYDFHSLQIAFDYVWQKAIDEGVIESAKEVGRQLQDLGGDPLGALADVSDPVKALRNELRVVESVHSTTNVGVMFRMQTNQNPTDNTGGGSPPPPRSPLPPVRPPINTDALVLTMEDTSPRALLNQLEALLNERFAFEIFAPGSVNFGILVSYRQKWTPINYQAGSLVKTITLAPKETRKVSVKRVVKKDRSVKEMEDSLRVRKEESANTARDEAEIVAKAEAKTNFSLTAKGSFDIGISDGDQTTVFGKDAASSSSDVKKAFREAVIKAAQEYKDERRIEVDARETFEDEETSTSEISNFNEEIPVTYLYYQLERRFHVSEHIHRLSPVVLVAMDVPNPNRRSIDALLLTHGWIIDRVLLDDQFRRPLEYFRVKIVGDEFALAALERNVAVLSDVVGELKKSYTQTRRNVNVLADLLTAQIVARAQATNADSSEGLWEKATEAVVGEGDDVDVEAARILEDAARERYERAVNQERELRSQLDSETASLNAAQEAYARAKAEHLNCLMDVGSLRLHIKENILYYMQAIWSHTFRDQIFLALHKKKVPRLATQTKTYRVTAADPPPTSVAANAERIVLAVEADLKLKSALDPAADFVTLAEVADLDNLMGFKGNYLIFPLKQSNALTDFMMTPYVDSELGLRDPDEFGNWTPEEFVAYARALHARMRGQLEAGEITAEELDAAVSRLTDQYRRLLSAPRRAEDEIIVPTGSLFIEALPGAHPILEDFKLVHRAIDVKKVQAEVRKLEMENVRYAARILAGERDDPDVDRKIVIDGKGETVLVPPGEG